MVDLKLRVLNSLRKLGDKKVRVALACSGGVDSMVLFHLLLEACKVSGHSLVVLHVNHMLRGESSFEDEDFLFRICKSYGVPLIATRRKVKEKSDESGLTLETAGREERMDFFSKIAKQCGLSAVFLAHHLDDHLETILFRLFRGTGLGGLEGIRSEHQFGKLLLLRPLLELAKADLLAYAKKKGLLWKEDESNWSREFDRNKIRHDLIPCIESIFGESYGESLKRLSSIAGAVTSHFRDSKVDWLMKRTEGVLVDLNLLPKSLTFEVLIECLRPSLLKLSKSCKMPSYKEALRIKEIMGSKLGASYELLNGVTLKKDRGFLLMSRGDFVFKRKVVLHWRNEVKTDLAFGEASSSFYGALLSNEDFSLRYAFSKEGLEAKRFSIIYPKRVQAWYALTWGGRPMKKVLSDKKVPLFLLSVLPLLCYENEPVLIPGICGREGWIGAEGALGLECSFE